MYFSSRVIILQRIGGVELCNCVLRRACVGVENQLINLMNKRARVNRNLGSSRGYHLRKGVRNSLKPPQKVISLQKNSAYFQHPFGVPSRQHIDITVYYRPEYMFRGTLYYNSPRFLNYLINNEVKKLSRIRLRKNKSQINQTIRIGRRRAHVSKNIF